MRLEAAFFIREVRQHTGRRPLLLWLPGLPVVLVGFWGLFVLYTLERQGLLRAGGLARPAMAAEFLVGLLLFWHALLCSGVGVYAGDRIFGEEHRRSTLEAALQVPLSPGRWLAAKLLFPLYLLAVAWIAPLPLYLLLGALDLAPMARVAAFGHVPLLAGLAALGLMLLFPPDYLERIQEARFGKLRPAGSAGREMSLRWLLVELLLVSLPIQAILARLRPWAGAFSLYGVSVPVPVVTGVTLFCFLGSAFLSARAAVSGRQADEERAHAGRLFALPVLYYLTLGLIFGHRWAATPLWLQAALLVGPPVVLFLFLRRGGPRREDRLAAEELRFFAARWDNPLALKDLRVYTRFASIRRALVTETALLGLLGAGLAWFLLVVMRETPEAFFDSAAGLLVAGAPPLVLTELAFRPFAAWSRERSAQTLPLLFVTPSSSKELLWGRLSAGICYALLCHAPLLAALLLALGRTLPRLEVLGWRAWLVPAALLPFAALWVVTFACLVRPQTAPPWRWQREDWLEQAVGLLHLGLLFAILALGGRPLFDGPLAVALAAGVFGVNSLTVVAIYWIRVRQLDALRWREAESGA